MIDKARPAVSVDLAVKGEEEPMIRLLISIGICAIHVVSSSRPFYHFYTGGQIGTLQDVGRDPSTKRSFFCVDDRGDHDTSSV